MINWLIRRFVKNYRDVSDPAVRTAYGQFAGIVGIICNVLLCLAKGAIGLAAGSVSIVADAVNNLSDAASNVVSFLGFKLASRPADKIHPYGHGRFEYLAGLVVAVLVCAVGIELARTGFGRILAPRQAEFTAPLIIVMLVSIGMKAWMMGFAQTVGGRIGSEAIEATAIDSRNDAMATLTVLICAVISRMTGYSLDGWVGLAMGAFVLVSGMELVRDAVNPLLGQAPSPELVKRIDSEILSQPGVLGTHDLMVHDYGPGREFASAHVVMSAEMDPMAAHAVLDRIERDLLRQEGLVITLHWDPVPMDPSERGLRGWAEELSRIIDPDLRVDGARSVPDADDSGFSEPEALSIHVLRPAGCDLADDEIRARLADLVRMRFPDAACSVTVADVPARAGRSGTGASATTGSTHQPRA